MQQRSTQPAMQLCIAARDPPLLHMAKGSLAPQEAPCLELQLAGVASHINSDKRKVHNGSGSGIR